MKERRSFSDLVKKNKATMVVLVVCAAIFAVLLVYANSGEEEETGTRSTYSVYERAKIEAVLEENLSQEPKYENNYVGNQKLRVHIESGEFEGMTLEAMNYLSALYGTKLSAGESTIVCISIIDNEIHDVSVYEYDKTGPIVGILVVFVLITVLVGGRRGAQSLVGLVVTVAALIWILLPLLMKGFPTVPTTLLLCIFLTVLCFTLLGGVSAKTVCAMLGTACGLGIAVLFALAAQRLCRVDGMRMSDYIDALLQLRMGGYELELKGLLIGGTIVSALGAVMDVAMSIASSTHELISVNPGMTAKELIKSGMNIGRDMIGTMTNTLILAFMGSSFIMVLYIYTMNVPAYELLSSNLVATEFVHAIASSVGVILSVPLTVVISSFLYKRVGNRNSK